MITVNVNADIKPNVAKAKILSSMVAELKENQTYTKEQINVFLKDVPVDSLDNMKTFASDYDVDLVITPTE